MDEALVEQVFNENRKFFSLPEAEKRRILADENNRWVPPPVEAFPSSLPCVLCLRPVDTHASGHEWPAHPVLKGPLALCKCSSIFPAQPPSLNRCRGYTPMSEETLDAPNQTEGDTKEGLYFGREVPPGSEEAHMPLHGPNQWPAQVCLQMPGTIYTAVSMDGSCLSWSMQGGGTSKADEKLCQQAQFADHYRRTSPELCYTCEWCICKAGQRGLGWFCRMCCQTIGRSRKHTLRRSQRWACACSGSWHLLWICRPSTSTPCSPGPCCS